MDTISALAAAGMRTRMNALDLLANNIANASTPGFKADREFNSVYMSEDNEAIRTPDTRDRWLDLSQGTLNHTGNPLDLAIAGPGFFMVDTPGGINLVRGGAFRIGTGGVLETSEEFRLRGQDGNPIRLNAADPVSVAQDGTVSQAGRVVGRLSLVDVSDATAVEKAGHGYFRLTDVKRMINTSGKSEVLQGKLEAANVSPAESAVRLVSVMRQFEMLQKAASIGSEMSKKAVEEVARATA